MGLLLGTAAATRPNVILALLAPLIVVLLTRNFRIQFMDSALVLIIGVIVFFLQLFLLKKSLRQLTLGCRSLRPWQSIQHPNWLLGSIPIRVLEYRAKFHALCISCSGFHRVVARKCISLLDQQQ
jgi:hypothetical protein